MTIQIPLVLIGGAIVQLPSGDSIGANVGLAVVNFGTSSGTNVTTVAVTGQTGILSTSKIIVNINPIATATHNAFEHMFVSIRLSASDIIAGTGFTIYAITDLRLTGTFNVQWRWN